MRVVSLFGGIGGFDLAFKRQGHEIVYYNDYDKFAVQTYNKNFKTEHQATDIRDVRSEDIPAHDLICGGFPCQSFSVAGKRMGFDDTRGTLFFEIMRLARYHRTKYLFLENVKGLLSHDDGRTFATILATLNECGYNAQWQVLNSKYFGVPQNRNRVFIIGHLRGVPRPEVFPIRQGDKVFTKDGEEAEVSSTLLASYYKGGVGDGHTLIQEVSGSQGMRVYNPKGISVTLSSNGGGLGAKTGMYEVDGRVRRLTPVECERLQGFPDGWTEGVSDTQRYKQLGNAVTVNVIEAIIKKWFK